MNWGRIFSYIYLWIGAYSALILIAQVILIIKGEDKDEAKTLWSYEEQVEEEKEKDDKGEVIYGSQESKN